MKKKFASIVIVVLVMLDVALGAFAVSPLVVNLGTITVRGSNDVIMSATLGSVSGVVSGNTVTFADSSMNVGDVETLTVNVKNTGNLASEITGIKITGNDAGVISINDGNNYNVAVAVGATVALTFTVTAVAAGSVTPSITINWS